MWKCSIFRANECITIGRSFKQMNAYFLLMNSKRCITLTEAVCATRYEEVGEGFSFIYSFSFLGSLAYLIII